MKKTLCLSLFILPLPVLLLSIFIGPAVDVHFSDVINLILHTHIDASDYTQLVIVDVRIPRILLVFLVGAALSASGCAMQAVFRNPLVDPYILGLSSGAAFGAALSIAYPILPLQLSAFVFGIGASGLSYIMALRNKELSSISLVLSGVIVGGIFTALLTIIQYISDPFKLQSIVQWIMGNFQNANWQKIQIAILPILLGCGILYMYRWRLNVLALGDDEAKSSGINPIREKIIILLAAGLTCSAAVSVAGIIGLYGLIVPHIVRMISGVDNRTAIPLNMALGGSLLVIIDDISRSLMLFELPIGVFTVLIGAPVFIYLMKKNNIGWER
jgi:iron complex transport system permease protein